MDPNSPTTKMDLNSWTLEEMVDPHENEHLISLFQEKEVKAIVTSMEKNITPDPNHTPIELFQTCW